MADNVEQRTSLSLVVSRDFIIQRDLKDSVCDNKYQSSMLPSRLTLMAREGEHKSPRIIGDVMAIILAPD